MRMHKIATIAAIATMTLPCLALAAPCAPATSHPTDTVRAFYAAAMAGNKAGILATLTPDFRAIDDGKRYDGPGLAAVVDYLKANHLTMAWTVDSPQESMSCDVAWADWDNHGSVTDAHGTKPLTWFESAVLRWQDGAWKMVLFHSTTISSKP